MTHRHASDSDPRPGRPMSGQSMSEQGVRILSFGCDYQTHMEIGGREDGADCVAEYEGTLRVRVNESGGAAGEHEQVAGKAHLFVVNAQALVNRGHDAFEVLERRDETAAYLALLDGAGRFSPAVRRVLGDDECRCQNFLILDRLEILPQFRGQKLGLRHARAASLRFGMGCRLAALRPFPLQFEGKLGGRRATEFVPPPEELQTAFDSARHRLVRYYTPLGFVPVQGTDLMIRDLSLRIPEVGEE